VLLAGRIALNVEPSKVADVGFASVVGADRIQHNEVLYTDNDIHGDTYGPVNYVAYVPFEMLFPTDGTWDTVPAAHAAAITFDTLIVLLLVLWARRFRRGPGGTLLAAGLAFAWLAYPYTGYVLLANTNDTLVAVLLLAAFIALRSAPLRGALLGAAAAAKFAPAVLVPLLATGKRRSAREWLLFGAAFAAVALVSVLVYLPPGGFREFWNTTIGFQLTRESPFSIWGQHPSLDPLATGVTVAVAALAVAVAVVPRQRSQIQVAALIAAVLIAFQLTVVHWFYFYIVWFAPFVLIALFSPLSTRERGGTISQETVAQKPKVPV
jgi:uncharacterized membrane protein